MKRKKKGLKVYRASNHSWFGDQLLKVISIVFGVIIMGGISRHHRLPGTEPLGFFPG